MGGAVVGGEIAADQDLAVGLDGQGHDGVVEAGAGVEGGIEGTVGVQAAQAVAGGAVEDGEGAADQDLAVGLEGQGIDRVVGVGGGQEAGVDGPIGLQTGEVSARQQVDGGESSADHQLIVWLPGQHVDRTFEAGADVEGGIECTGIRDELERHAGGG